MFQKAFVLIRVHCSVVSNSSNTNKRAGVNFINVLCTHFSYKILVPKTTQLWFGFEVLAQKILYKKMHAYNVDEIDS